MATDLAAARRGDERAFDRLVAAHRRELYVHCYRMLGSHDDAEDALQESLLAAWRGLPGLRAEDALRSWLYQVTTRCALRAAERRPQRVLSWEVGPPRSPGADLGEPVTEAPWLEPWVESADADPARIHARRESVGLAYVAALQHLPSNQRAVLILRDVLRFSAAEVADLLDTSIPSITSALQRARSTIAAHAPALDDERPGQEVVQRTVAAFVAAFDAGDVDAVVSLLAADVRFTMPPLPAWFDGRDDVAAFLADRTFASPWRAIPVSAEGEPTLACYQHRDGALRLSALIVLHVDGDGAVTWIASFLDPALLRRLEVPDTL